MTDSSSFTIPFGAWHGDSMLTCKVPDAWNVYQATPADGEPLDPNQIENAFAEPVGTPALSVLAEGKKNAVIAIEDITRPTPVHLFIEKVIEEITKGGIPEEKITIIFGTAAHRPMTDKEIRLKIGAKTAERIRVMNHDFMSVANSFVGNVDKGSVYLNAEFLRSDLKILIGSVIPHGEAGFGGAAKMVVPGLAERRTIAHFHGALPPRFKGLKDVENGSYDRRKWSEAVAEKVGIDAVICGVVNAKRQLAGLFIGDVIKAHRMAANKACQVSKTVIDAEMARSARIVIANAYPLDTDPVQMGKALGTLKGLQPEYKVLINAASDGIFYHGMGMGSGIDFKRLTGNIPAFLKPANLKAFFRSLPTALKSPELTARLLYFSLNALSYEKYKITQGQKPADLEAEIPLSSGTDSLVFSPNFPLWGFRRKYPKCALYRQWDHLVRDLSSKCKETTVLLLPCAPVQLVEIV